MAMYSKLLIPLDGSKTAERVLPYARYLAARLKLRVELMAIIEMTELAAHAPPGRAPVYEKMVDNETARSEAYLNGVAATFGGMEVQCTVEKGRPGEVLARRSGAGSGLLMAMTTHGRSGVGRVLMGSVAEKVLRTAGSTLIVRADDETPTVLDAKFAAIIVPLDGSELAAAVLPQAAELARALGAEVILFRAYHIPYSAYADEESLALANYDQLTVEMRDEATKYLEEKAAELRRLGVEKVSCVSREGRPADEIIALGRKTADNLIVMGSHGRSGVERWVLGSVAETVARHAAGPVLIAHPA
jgi:nucleotide-binding universal stress UspA family protein